MNSLSLACRSLLVVDSHFFTHFLSPENRILCDKIANYLFGNGNPLLEQDVDKINASLAQFKIFFNEREVVPGSDCFWNDVTYSKFHSFREERPLYAFPHFLEIFPEWNSIPQLFPDADVGHIFPVGRSPHVISLTMSAWEQLQKDFPDDHIAIEEFLCGPMTLETMVNAEKMQLLTAWRKARDTFRVWQVIAQSIKSEMPDIKSKKAVEEQIEPWFEKNKDRLENLSVLGLNNLNLIYLPLEIIEKCINLKELYLMFNNLSSLPPTIGKLRSLQKLNVEGNKLLSLPPEIGQLTSLTYLDAKHNRLTSLPREIGNLGNLKFIIVDHNKISSVPAEVQHLKSLIEFEFSDNQLLSLPSEIGQLTHLRFLGADKNKISSVPAEIQHLKSLESFRISQNQLPSLPPEIGQLTSLLRLDLRENRLASLPSSIGNLGNLVSFEAHRNKLSSLPIEIQHLKSLETLTVSENQLPSLPPEIGQLTSLTRLDIHSNQLTSLPEEMKNLASLQWLDVRDNDLESIPDEIRKKLNSKEQLIDWGNRRLPGY